MLFLQGGAEGGEGWGQERIQYNLLIKWNNLITVTSKAFINIIVSGAGADIIEV